MCRPVIFHLCRLIARLTFAKLLAIYKSHHSNFFESHAYITKVRATFLTESINKASNYLHYIRIYNYFMYFWRLVYPLLIKRNTDYGSEVVILDTHLQVLQTEEQYMTAFQSVQLYCQKCPLMKDNHCWQIPQLIYEHHDINWVDLRVDLLTICVQYIQCIVEQMESICLFESKRVFGSYNYIVGQLFHRSICRWRDWMVNLWIRSTIAIQQYPCISSRWQIKTCWVCSC
jgi:hypothetical protein